MYSCWCHWYYIFFCCCYCIVCYNILKSLTVNFFWGAQIWWHFILCYVVRWFDLIFHIYSLFVVECILLLWYTVKITRIWKYHKLTFIHKHTFFFIFGDVGGERISFSYCYYFFCCFNIWQYMTTISIYSSFSFFFLLLFGSLKFFWWREIFTKLKYITSYYEVMTFFVCVAISPLVRGEEKCERNIHLLSFWLFVLMLMEFVFSLFKGCCI